MKNEEAVKWFQNELNSLSHIQYVCGFDYLRFKKQRMMILLAIKALRKEAIHDK